MLAQNEMDYRKKIVYHIPVFFVKRMIYDKQENIKQIIKIQTLRKQNLK